MEIWSEVPREARAAFVARARALQASLRTAGVSYWVFEQVGAPDRLVQYVEAKDARGLDEARAIIGSTAGDEVALLHQLEL
jgi:hypothetical protein